jgi:serine/threonine-protein kinase
MPATSMDRKTFLANVRRSGLVAPDQLAAAVVALPDTERGRLVARALVERGLLTKFQAELLLAGRTSGFVLGQYRITDQLGRGGMGRVFKARHQTMNRVVALKMITPSLVKTEKAQALFQREVQAAARLIHANIVTAYDANLVGDRHYLVMELVDGPNLEQLTDEQGPLPVGQACDFVRQAAAGLQYAHEMGMVHRDIKPSNLLVKPADGDPRNRPCVVKILDFGLARLHEPAPGAESGAGTILTRENTVMGTPDYIAPEQARDLHKADIRSDLYSLGGTFFYLLTGRVPFPGGTTMEKLVRHATEEAAEVESLRPEVPAAVAAVVRKLLAKDPAARYQTPAELAAALEPFAVGGPPGWRPTPAARPESDSPATPAPAGSGSEADVPPTDWDDECALVGTLTQDQASTSMSAFGPPSLRLRRSVELEQRQRFTVALVWAVGIVFGLLALLALFMLK